MKNKLLHKILIFIFVVILFTCIGLTNSKNRQVTIMENVINIIFKLPQEIYIKTEAWLTGKNETLNREKALREQNKLLQEKNKELEEKMANYEILAAENKLLKEHDNLVKAYPNYKLITADIIADTTSNWEEVYVINKGSKDGIKEKMSVITMRGLVGYVLTVSENTAKVISILDAGNAVSSRITRTRDAVICKGNILLKDDGKLKLTYIPIGVEVMEGDKIETSGMGGLYPKGIPIGEVKSFVVKKNPAENEAIIQAYVDFNKIETVAVIVEEI